MAAAPGAGPDAFGSGSPDCSLPPQTGVEPAMGADAYSHVYLGALVDSSELLVSVSSVPYKCGTCPPSHSLGKKFCSDCGTKLDAVRRTEWNDTVKAYLTGLGQSTEYDHFAGEDGLLVDVCGETSSEARSDSRVYAVAECIAGAGGYKSSKGGVKAVSMTELQAAGERVKAKLKGLGLGDRELKIFCQLYWSV